MRKECRDFFFLLSACYFRPERKYSSEEVKELAKQAMISLWQRKSITVWSIEFEREFIRDLIINKNDARGSRPCDCRSREEAMENFVRRFR